MIFFPYVAVVVFQSIMIKHNGTIRCL